MMLLVLKSDQFGKVMKKCFFTTLDCLSVFVCFQHFMPNRFVLVPASTFLVYIVVALSFLQKAFQTIFSSRTNSLREVQSQLKISSFAGAKN